MSGNSLGIIQSMKRMLAFRVDINFVFGIAFASVVYVSVMRKTNWLLALVSQSGYEMPMAKIRGDQQVEEFPIFSHD